MGNKVDPVQPTGETYWDKYGMPRVSLTEGLWQIEQSLKHNQTRGVILLVSEAGEGKSQGIGQLARKYNRRLVDIRTAQLTHIGCGVPQRADETGHFKVAVPDNWPHPDEKCILLFDEYNQGQYHALALVFQMLEDRGVYNYKVPNDCLIVLLMNPSTANYTVTKIETNPAINRRVKKFYVYNTFEDWKKHAQTDAFHYTDGIQKPCHKWILNFLETTPAMLYTMRDRDTYKQFCCPATWQTVSLDLYNMDEEGIELSSGRVENRLAATINPVNAKAVCDYIRDNAIRIMPSEILTKYEPKSMHRKKVKEMIKKANGDLASLVENLANYIFDQKPSCEKIAPQLCLFWSDLPDEMSQAFYNMLGAASESGKGGSTAENVKYMTELTLSLQTNDLWDQINERNQKHHDNFERALKGTEEMPDPMED
jgi:hypothetical protein